MKKQEREEKHKCKLAVCAIRKQISGGQGVPIVGTGSLVRNLFPELERKTHLLTSKEVISSDNLKGYYLCFKKLQKSFLRSTDKKPVELASLVNPNEKPQFSSGLTIIPVDPNQLSRIRKHTSGLVNHRPFSVYGDSEGIEDQSCELYCHVVEVDRTSHVVRPFKVGKENGLQFLADHQYKYKNLRKFCAGQSTRKPDGAPITTTFDGKAVAVGALTFRNNQISPVFFSQLTTSALTCSGKQL